MTPLQTTKRFATSTAAIKRVAMAEEKEDFNTDELMRLLKKLPVQDLPTGSFAKIPRETREWLVRLTPEDISEIKEAVRFLRSARTIGRFGRYALFTVISMTVGGITFGEKLAVGWRYLTGASK